LANIISLAAVRKNNRVTMDTAVEPALCVHLANGSVMKFTEYSTGLYFHDARAPKVATSTSESVIAYSFLNTVEHNKKQFTPKEIEGADAARALYSLIGRPAQEYFEEILIKNLILNCPVTVADAKRALYIYGPDVAALKGKTTKGTCPGAPMTESLAVPDYILEHHKEVFLCVDLFYVQGLCFFHTISKKLKFRTITILDNRKQATLLKAIMDIIKQYHSRAVSLSQQYIVIENSSVSVTIFYRQIYKLLLPTLIKEMLNGPFELLRSVRELLFTVYHSDNTPR
jgi:hypothetical protein